MKLINQRKKIVRYTKKLNSTNLSSLRSGNISIRAKNKGINGFFITPSGINYSSLKPKDIIFVSLKGQFNKKKGKPSSDEQATLKTISVMLYSFKSLKTTSFPNFSITFCSI